MLVGIVGCRKGEIAPGVTDSTFVAAMTALIRINGDATRDSAQKAIARDSVLQSRDLTEARLERAARALGDDPDRALAVWQRINKAAGPVEIH